MTNEPAFPASAAVIEEPPPALGEVVDAVEAAQAVASFADALGVDERWVFQSRWGGEPVLLWPADFIDSAGNPLRRWEGLRPSEMWHPLVWLPDDLASRYDTDEGGASVVETDDEWAARVLIECAARGVYNPEAGTWVDVLDLIDLDVDDLQVQARLAGWLDGLDDPVFDNLWLPPLPEVGADGFDPNWARRQVLDMVDDLERAVVAYDQASVAAFFEDMAVRGTFKDEPVEVFGLLAHHVQLMASHDPQWGSWGDGWLKNLHPLLAAVAAGDRWSASEFDRLVLQMVDAGRRAFG